MPTERDAGVAGGAKAKRPRTEKRAQQNRVAQKRYRDKLKQRTEQLASFAAKHGFDPDASEVVSDTSSTLDTMQQSENETQVISLSDSEGQSRVGVSARKAWPELTSHNAEQLTALLVDESVAADLVIKNPEEILAQFENIGPDSKIIRNRKLMLEHCFHILGLNVSGSSNSTLTKLASLQGVNLREILLAGVKVMVSHGLVPAKLSDLYTNTANPYANSLRFKRFATLDALLSNAMSMGFDIANLYKVHHPSPFYRPDIKSAADIHGATADYFMGIAPHLRPTSVQIRCWHKPWIDLIPFPVFRMRMILAINKNPPTADPWELKHDIFHDGVSFVGATSSEEGEPWDMQSWRIAPWFKKKWDPILMGDQIEEE